MIDLFKKPLAQHLPELVAVVSSLLYTYLYIEGSVWCWGFAAVGSLVFMVLTWKKKIYAESFLHVFYLGMAAYGYVTLGNDFPPPKNLDLVVHLKWGSVAVVLTLASAFLLKRVSGAKLPLIDSFTTVFSLLATWLMVTNVHENWLYWIVIDLVAIFLYYKRGMKLSSLLFVIYLILAIKGYTQGLN